MAAETESLFGEEAVACPECGKEMVWGGNPQWPLSRMLKAHMTNAHPDLHPAAGSGEEAPSSHGEAAEAPPRRRNLLSFLGQKKAAPASQPSGEVAPKRKAPSRRKGRTSTAPAWSAAWSMAAMAAGTRGMVPVSKALSIQAPVAGQVLDRAIEGSLLDRRVFQPIAGEADKWAEVGSLVAFPVLVAVHAQRPTPVTDSLLDAIIEQNLLALARAMKAAKARERQLATAVEELAGEGLIPAGENPVRALKEWLFATVEVPVPDLVPDPVANGVPSA